MLGLAALPVVAIPQAAEAAAGQSYLTRGQSLSSGQSISTYTQAGARTWLIMQSDGNLVLYTTGTPGTGPRRACWASNTTDNGLNSHAVYQQDQNFVVYAGFGAYTATWASNTRNDGGTTVNINRYGQLWAGWKQISGFCT
jgi:hypothetical protein